MTAAIPTIAEAARQIAARELSPVELTHACLERMRRSSALAALGGGDEKIDARGGEPGA